MRLIACHLKYPLEHPWPYERDISRDKTPGDLAREALWFLTHTFIAFVLLAIVVGVMSFNHPDPDSSSPKLLGTVLALLAPMLGGFLLARIHHNSIASTSGSPAW